MLNNIPNQVALKPEDFKFGKDLFYRYSTKEIDEVEFDREIVYFSLQCGFEELVKHPHPTRPEELIHYDHLTLQEKDKINRNPEFWHQKNVKDYLNTKYSIKFQNRANKKWLEYLLKKLEEYQDTVCASKVRTRLNEFAVL